MKSSQSDRRGTIVVILVTAALLLIFVLGLNLGHQRENADRDTAARSDQAELDAWADAQANHGPEGRAEYMDKYKSKYMAEQKALRKARARQK